MSAKPANTVPALFLPVRYRLALLCVCCDARPARKLQAMDISLRTARTAALPGSQRQTTSPQALSLAVEQAPQALRLRAWESAQLRVRSGTVWLTQDGKPDDLFLVVGQQLLLLGPACYRLGALDCAGVELSVQKN